MDLLDVTISLMGERVPLGYSQRAARQECRKLGPLFVSEDEWAQTLAGTIEGEADLNKLATRMVQWVRDRGYPILDEPPSTHSSAPRARGVWAPRSSLN